LQSLQKNGLVDKPEAIDWLVYQRAYYDFAFFASYFFPKRCRAAFSKMHMDFCRAEADPARRGRREVTAAPRSNAKTTFKLTLRALHAIVYGYDPFILIIAHSASEAEEKVGEILEELDSNPRLIRVYGRLAPVRGQKGPGRWGKKKFVTPNGIMVMAKSRGQQIRGLNYGGNRPSLIICDDVESPSGVLSPEQRLKTRDWFYKDVLKCGQVDGSTNFILIGTCLHQESLLSELLKNPGFQSGHYQSVLSYADRQDLWEAWQTLYTDLSNPNRHQDATAYFKCYEAEMLQGTRVLWPEGEPYEYLMRLRVDEGIASFQSEKQNDPFDPERQLFDMRRARRFRILYDNGAFHGVEWLDGSGKRILRNEFERIVAFHDPALGKKQGQRTEPDFAAIVVVAKDHDGYLYCLDAYIEKDIPSRQIERAFQLHDLWELDMLYLEENHFQELLKPLYAEVNNHRSDNHLRIKGVIQTENKYKRISTLEPDITNGYLLVSDTLTPRLTEQLTQFPTSYDDGPDALQGAVSQLKKRYDAIRNAPDSSEGPRWF
jgi:predicted phage terminase large subunit-like protein